MGAFRLLHGAGNLRHLVAGYENIEFAGCQTSSSERMSETVKLLLNSESGETTAVKLFILCVEKTFTN